MADYHDAVVIGAGLGGLAAALRLTVEGLRVIVLDRNAHPGGTAAYHFKRGYRFPMGPLGFGNPRLVGESLGLIGLDEAPDILPLNFQFRAFGISASLAPPLESLVRRLDSLFPGDEPAVNRFFESVRSINERLDSARHGATAPDLARAERSSAGEFLSGPVSDWRLARILGSIGTCFPRAGMPFIASLWKMLSGEGLAYPAGGFPALIGTMIHALEASGRCSFRLGSAAARIVVSGGRVRGVSLADGSTVEAPAVISNADVKTTYLGLLDPRDVPPAWRRAALDAKLTTSGFHVSLGVDSGAVDLSAFDGGSRIIYRGGEPSGGDDVLDVDWSPPEIEPEELARQELEVDLLSAEDSAVAPAGGAVVLIRPTADHAHFARFRAAPGSRFPSYSSYKERLAHALIKEVAKLLPGLPSAVSVIDTATPLTYEERGGRFEGAIAGWAPDPLQMGDCSLRELVRTPVVGLYLAGHQVLSWMMLGGVPTAFLTGIRAADAVLAGEPPAAGVGIPVAP